MLSREKYKANGKRVKGTKKRVEEDARGNRKLKDMEVQQHDISLEQELDYEDDRDSTDREFEDAEETHDSLQTKSSISGVGSYLTPSFLKADTTSTPASILEKRSNAPKMRQLNNIEEKESGGTQIKEIAPDSFSFQEQRGRGLFPRTFDQDMNAS